ncbi:hypothetical protein CEXT_790471 [Caerostris extrusa]|uniref:Uncharacterized protein n=1 Tax=Caerostris extrusa TaxID=172846 RepID=A0AAV4WCW1_CAEEX|nr:hypothetical protein CEXT_790471 [Caerostris extrusa]
MLNISKLQTQEQCCSFTNLKRITGKVITTKFAEENSKLRNTEKHRAILRYTRGPTNAIHSRITTDAEDQRNHSRALAYPTNSISFPCHFETLVYPPNPVICMEGRKHRVGISIRRCTPTYCSDCQGEGSSMPLPLPIPYLFIMSQNSNFEAGYIYSRMRLVSLCLDGGFEEVVIKDTKRSKVGGYASADEDIL